MARGWKLTHGWTTCGVGVVLVDVGSGVTGRGEGSGTSAIGGGDALGVGATCNAVEVAAGVSRLQARVKAASEMINFPREKPAGGRQ